MLVAMIGAALVQVGSRSVQGVSADADMSSPRPVQVLDPTPTKESAPVSTPDLPAATRPPADAATKDSTPATQPPERSATVATSAAPAPMDTGVPPPSVKPAAMPAQSRAADSHLVDINTASADELNSLGGRFGKAIVRGRPYRSIDELVSRRILTRAVFNRIKDRIAAR
ncbi:MAG TPA: helix-hairpin-helix domain-containing protein [Microvirga sp.]|nr:helix-hairpin-helix domain-containing protein [Microvirga sp.]